MKESQGEVQEEGGEGEGQEEEEEEEGEGDQEEGGKRRKGESAETPLRERAGARGPPRIKMLGRPRIRRGDGSSGGGRDTRDRPRLMMSRYGGSMYAGGTKNRSAVEQGRISVDEAESPHSCRWEEGGHQGQGSHLGLLLLGAQCSCELFLSQF